MCQVGGDFGLRFTRTGSTQAGAVLWSLHNPATPCPLCAKSRHCAASLEASRCKEKQTAQAALTVFEMRTLGHGFILDCTNDRREYGAASATGNHL
jgi:hypothetical protein